MKTAWKNRTQPVLAMTALAMVLGAPAAAQDDDQQTVLAPGVYSYQTRLDHSSCGDRVTSGVVRTYVAVVSGIPGSREMSMQLLNSDWWSTWTLRVTDEGHVIGDAQQDRVTGPARGDSHFELRLDDDKLSGRGSRSYTQRSGGRTQRCRMSYDSLLISLQ